MPAPWYQNLVPGASRWGNFGEIMPEEEFLGMLKICDEFDIILLEEGFHRKVITRLKEHPLISSDDILRLGQGVPIRGVGGMIHMPLREYVVGCPCMITG